MTINSHPCTITLSSRMLFCDTFDFLQTLNISFDFITIPETWLDVWNISDYELSGYQAFHTIVSHKKGGGVAIFVKKKNI